MPLSATASSGLQQACAPAASVPAPRASAVSKYAPADALPTQRALMELVLRGDDAGLAEALAAPSGQAVARAARYRHGRSLLHVAASTGRPSAIAVVREAGLDPMQPDDCDALPLHEALGWYQGLGRALAKLIYWQCQHSEASPQSAPAMAWLAAAGPRPCRLSELEEMLRGSDEEALASVPPLARISMAEMAQGLDFAGIPSIEYSDLEVGALTLATARLDLKSLHRLLRGRQLCGADARAALVVDHILRPPDAETPAGPPTSLFRDALVTALWTKKYAPPRQRFLDLVPTLVQVRDVARLRALARSIRSLPDNRGQAWLSTPNPLTPLALLLKHHAPLSLVTYYVQAGACIHDGIGSPGTMAPVLLAAGLHSHWLAAFAIVLCQLQRTGAYCQRRGFEPLGRRARREYVTTNAGANVYQMADDLDFQHEIVAFLLKEGASPHADFAFTLDTGSSPLACHEPCFSRRITLLDLALVAGAENIARLIIHHAEYRPSPQQAHQTRMIAAVLIATEDLYSAAGRADLRSILDDLEVVL